MNRKYLATTVLAILALGIALLIIRKIGWSVPHALGGILLAVVILSMTGTVIGIIGATIAWVSDRN